MMSPPFIEDLLLAARDAEVSETTYRREAAARIAVLEQNRAFAFRRVNLMKNVAEAVAEADSEEAAIRNALSMLQARLGWTSESEARTAVLTQFAAVPRALYAERTPNTAEETADVRAALAAFERWYAEGHTTPFWHLFEHHIPETPRVDF